MNNSSVPGNAGNTSDNASEVLNTLAKKRSIIPLAFAVIIIFFFFSFVDFKCNSVKVASLTGMNMVTGTHIKTAADNFSSDNYFNSLDNNRAPVENKGDKVEPNLWAIVALLSAVGGFAAYYKKIKKESLAGTAAGAIGIISLLILRSAIKNKISDQSGGMVPIEIDFLFGYWASLLAFFMAGGLSYLRLKQEKLIESPADISPVSKPVTPLHVNIITQDKQTDA
ncbi:MAG TPA: hypothetical protein VLI68_17260 [Hanamia sp.]|jgi:hypothetical protein|nr:hypothetical protein [Hanamia sp.]